MKSGKSVTARMGCFSLLRFRIADLKFKISDCRFQIEDLGGKRSDCTGQKEVQHKNLRYQGGDGFLGRVEVGELI